MFAIQQLPLIRNWAQPYRANAASAPLAAHAADPVDRFVPSEESEPLSKADQARLRVGQRAEGWGVRSPRTNPNTGDQNWENYSLGWARRGLEAASGRKLPLLHAADSTQAYKRAQKAGKLHHGEPPAGAIVFAPNGEGGYKVGFANDDGRTFQTTVPRSESRSTIGTRELPEDAAWMMPPSRVAKHKKAEPKADSKAGSEQQQHSEIGLEARNWGVRKAKNNPNNGTTSWGGYCLGWARRAVEHAAGRQMPLLHAEGANDAYANLRKHHKIHFGSPPPGALVFWDHTNSELGAKFGHVAIVNPDGHSYRGTSSERFGKHHHVGDTNFSKRELKHIGWVMPEDL